MEFVFYHEGINNSRTLTVDGFEETRLNLSHWPGNQTPEHLKADTSTEIALNLAADPYADRLLENIEMVSNNHFDTDGLLSCWAVFHPRKALAQRDFLIHAAQAGDFGWFPNPQAVKFDLVVSAFEDLERSPLRKHFAGLEELQRYQLIYDALLEELPGFFFNFEQRYRDLWEEEFMRLEEARRALSNGAANIREHEDAGVSVLETSREFPMSSRFNACRYDRMLTFTKAEDGWVSEFVYHILSWFETKTLSTRPRRELTPLVDRLNAAENRADAGWQADAPSALYPRLALFDKQGHPIPSRLSKDFIENEILQFFMDLSRMQSPER